MIAVKKVFFSANIFAMSLTVPFDVIRFLIISVVFGRINALFIKSAAKRYVRNVITVAISVENISISALKNPRFIPITRQITIIRRNITSMINGINNDPFFNS